MGAAGRGSAPIKAGLHALTLGFGGGTIQLLLAGIA